MAEIGYASLGIIPSFKGFEPALEKGTAKHMLAAGDSGGRTFGEAAGRSAGRRFGGVFKTAAKASLIGAAGLGAVAFKVGKDAIEQASDLGESLNAVNVTYEEQAEAVNKLGKEAANTLGLSQTEFNALAVRYSAFADTIAGGNSKRAVGVLDDLTTRAADFASVMNLEVNEAAELFQSGLAGETEPLRRYGLDLSAAAVEHHALATGIADSKGELTEAEKVQARYSLLMQDTTKTAGDFANTSDSLANRQRILNARWDDAQAKLGTALIPYMEDLVGFLLDKGLPAFEDFSDWFTTKGIPAIEGFAEDVRPLAKSLLPAMGDALGITRDALSEAAPYAKRMVDAFNDMPDWGKAALLGGGALAYGGLKLRGKGGGGGLGGVISKAKPVPVFVTNPGFGGDVPGGGAGKHRAGGKLGKWGRLGGAAAGLAGVGFFADPLLTNDEKVFEQYRRGAPTSSTGMFGTDGVRGMMKATEKVREFGEDSQLSRKRYEALREEISSGVRVDIDDSDIRFGIGVLRDYAAELRAITKASEGFQDKLRGQSYPTGGGVNIYGGLNVQADTYDDIMRKGRERVRRSSSDGIRSHVGDGTRGGIFR